MVVDTYYSKYIICELNTLHTLSSVLQNIDRKQIQYIKDIKHFTLRLDQSQSIYLYGCVYFPNEGVRSVESNGSCQQPKCENHNECVGKIQ